MAYGNVTIPIPGELRAVDSSGVVASTASIYDYVIEKTQEEINTQVLSGELVSDIRNSVNSLQIDISKNKDSISDLENEVKSLKKSVDTLNTSNYTLKPEPDAYIRNVHYDISNNNSSQLKKYINDELKSERLDQPLPVKFYDSGALSIYTDRLKGNVIPYHKTDSYRYVYNLIPNKRYFYRLSGVWNSFVVEGTRRFIYADSVKNVRDLGGILTEDGGYIAYDKIFRGSELKGETIKTFTNAASSELKTLKLTLDLDLREFDETDKSGKSPLNISYLNIPFVRFEQLEGLNDVLKNSIKQAFEAVANEVLSGGKVYLHCAWGFHRAGFLSTLIEGVLGAKQCEIDKDYELSSFSDLETVTRDDENYKNGINIIKTQYGGSWERLLLICGVDKSLITHFRSAMIVNENRLDEDGPLYYETTYQELVNLKNNGFLIPGAKYRMVDYMTETYYDVSKRVGCSGLADLPAHKSANHPFDLVVTALSNSELDCNVKALHTTRDVEGYFDNEDLSKWELKYDIENNKQKYSWAVNDNIKIGENDVELVYGTTKANYRDSYYYNVTTIYEETLTIECPNNSRFRGKVISSDSSNFKVGDQVEVWTMKIYGYGVTNVNNSYSIRLSSLKFYYKEIVYRQYQGKGVIYYMKDEYNNELPYDFKNILFRNESEYIPTFNSKASNVIIKPLIEEGVQHLNANLFILNSEDDLVDNVFFDNNSRNNIIFGDAINCKFGKYCSNNSIKNAENCVLGDDNINIKTNYAYNLYVGNACFKLTIGRLDTSKYLKIEDGIYDRTISQTKLESMNVPNKNVIDYPYDWVIDEEKFNEIIGV